MKAGDVELDSGDGRLVVGTTVAGSAVAMLTATVVNIALPTLADDLGAGAGAQQWVINSYLLVLAAMILIGGNLGDRFGRLRIYRLGVAWFAAASLLCAVAPTVETLIGARILQGVGGALLTPGSLAIIEATLRPDDRGRGVGQWSGLVGVSGAIGPLVGGLLVDLSWRWVFLLNLPVALAVLALSVRLPETRNEAAGDSSIDLAGAVLTALTLGALSYGLIEREPIGAAVAAAGAAALIVVERRQAHPMLDVGLFRIRTFLAANVVTLLVYGGMGIGFFLLSIQLQVSLGWSPLAAGAAQLPITLLMLVLSSRGGELAQRVGPRWPLTVGPLMIAAAMLWMSRIDAGDSYVLDVLPPVVVFGLGLCLSVAPVTATALGSIPDDRSGAASGINNAISRTGQLLAVAAIPPMVGLTGDALSEPTALTAGFSDAMVVGAVSVAVGGIAAAVLFRPTPTADTGDTGDARYHCPVESPQLARRT